VFAAISGSSIVTMLAIGSVMLPAMLKAGYSDKFALGAVMAGGTLGIIIPPSIPMIIYGLVTETSITELFVAGIGPGSCCCGVCRCLRDVGQPQPAAQGLRRSAAWARRCAKASGRC
jgi:TRAP-type C4-dicarboxylate transport system permease large subunit